MQSSSACRPQLSVTQAQQFSYQQVLAYTGKVGAERLDPWDPEADVFMTGRAGQQADYKVCEDAPDDSTTQFSSIQAAVDAAIFTALEQRATQRIYIKIAAGIYSGLVYVPKLVIDNVAVGITLFADDNLATTIVENIDAQMPAAEFTLRFARQFANSHPLVRQMYEPITQLNGVISTFNASVLRIANEGFQLRGVSVINSYHCDRRSSNASIDEMEVNAQGQFVTGQHQAVALLIAGADKVHVADVKLSSFQDTLFLREPAPFETARSYFKNCFIEGDIDFIFGQSTGFFSQCEIKMRGERSSMAYMSAPSTHIDTKYGLVFDHCEFTHDGSDNALSGVFTLGRQWFEAVRCTPYGNSELSGYSCALGESSQFDAPPTGTISRKTLFSVGKCIIMNSTINAHINFAAPWSEWCGGEFDRQGDYIKGPWHPRFRPVQYSLKDMLMNLKSWPDLASLDMSKTALDVPWIGEYKNTDIKCRS